MPDNPILSKMLDRLYGTLVKGPSLNCRPHASRQRVDLTSLADFEDVEPRRVMLDLLCDTRSARVSANVPAPPDYLQRFGEPTAERPAEDDPRVRAWRRQKSLLTKLRHLSEDAKTYEQDTGVAALNVGYPILSLPPGAMGGGTRRTLAPVAFVPVAMEVNTGRKPGVTFACRSGGIDLVTPNAALMAWLERETGEDFEELFEDQQGDEPWREINELIRRVSRMLELNPQQADRLTDPNQFVLTPTPRAEDLPNAATVLASAVVGLFPIPNQGLLRDTRHMLEAGDLTGPVRSFIDVDVSLDAAEHDVPDADASNKQPRRFDDERFIARADPCQGRTVAAARTSTGLVIHGPPGTGKSQTITNIIGDHLARGHRVLFVCDKRTALDVVANRLEHLGLGGLCALVHDPQRDQRDLYMSIRARLDELNDIKTPASCDKHLQKVDRELQGLHDELTRCHGALMDADEDGTSFHDLAGRWLAIDDSLLDAPSDSPLRAVTPEQFEEHRQDIEVILSRARSVEYPRNPWAQCLGTSLDAFLARPMDALRRGLASCVEDARVADATLHEYVPPFDPEQALDVQAKMRVALADRLEWIGGHVDATIPAHVAAMTPEDINRLHQSIRDAAVYRRALGAGPLDAELNLSVRASQPPLTRLNRDIGDLERYIHASSKWYGFLAFAARSAAGKAMREYGLRRSPDEAKRLHGFLTGLRARIVLTDLRAKLTGSDGGDAPVADDVLSRDLDHYSKTIEARRMADGVEQLAEAFAASLTDAERRACLLPGLRKSPARAEALAQLETSLTGMDLFDATWLHKAAGAIRAGRKAGDTLVRLQQRFDTTEPVLRVRDGSAKLPVAFHEPIVELIRQSAEPVQGLASLDKVVLAGEIARRIAAAPALQQLDDQRIANSFERYRRLDAAKRDLVRDSILYRWVSKQKQRLLAGTGTRLNSDGADLRRRLFVRGKRAMRLRQVIAVGEKIDGGDPLFDLCPIWMASPETVAQVFPRRPMFDVVIFDEASQCRLEEALPVLTRARRVVIAGDPKQLPPTRFFEASIISSDNDDFETDQDVFEAQQAEVEDLLGAALNLEVHESYLDVHYRSRNADLIAFSNEQFYHSRLQAIPGHPSNRTRFPPLTLHRVGGVYDERCNPAEAKRVCEIIRDLLKRADPPSIGVACFNLYQRDLIADTLDDLALEDDAFANRLAEARDRRGEGSFEGLFVKNLENVQGDERDHIIISTTYGSNPEGRFYRRFGPLGRAGGGRRLNVLVTRAREEVHLVTSIPREAYQAADPITEGATPTGGWLLFAYLRYAEELAEEYEQNHRILEQAETAEQAGVVERTIEPSSRFALALGRHLARLRNIGSDVHWGNTGFCIDAALHHPERVDDVTIGILCDFTRFPYAHDPVEWEVFRAGILEWQGWTLHRVWTPHFFRDPERFVNEIERRSGATIAQEA